MDEDPPQDVHDQKTKEKTVPTYQFKHKQTGEILELTRTIAERDNCPDGYERVVIPQTVGYANSSHLRETGADADVPKAFRNIELAGTNYREIERQTGFSVDTIKRTWAMLLTLTCFLVYGAQAADITAGTTFTDGQTGINASIMNAIVGQAVINSAFITGKNAVSAPTADGSDQFITSVSGTLKRVTLGTLLANTNIIASQSEDTTPATNDFVLTYDTSAAALKKVALTNLVRASGPASFTVQSNVPVPSLSVINVAHGLGGVPQIAKAVLVCTVATNNVAVGDEIDLAYVRTDPTTDSTFGRPVSALTVNATNVYVSAFDCAAGVVSWQNKNSGVGLGQAVNTNFFAVKVYLYRFP